MLAKLGLRHQPSSRIDQRTGLDLAANCFSNLDVKRLTVTSTPDSNTTPTAVTVTVTYPFTTITHFPGVPSLTLSRTVKATVAPNKVN